MSSREPPLIPNVMRTVAMREHELNSYRETLLELRRRLTDEVRDTVEGVADKAAASDELSHLPTHPADRDSEELTRDIMVETNREQMLDAIDDALARIRAGTYGQCEACGAEIPKSRLDVLPFAVRCVDCEQKQEAKQ
ncbi:MAG: TraR/DksA family transcriptional regulator [Planctomycetota bacterium]